MKSNRIRALALVCFSMTVSTLVCGDDFDKLLNEIGAAPAVEAKAGTAPESRVAGAPDSDLSIEEIKKARAAKVDTKASLVPPDEKTIEEARIMAQQEEVRKQAQEVKARKDLDKGTKAMRSGDYEQAIKLLEETVRAMPSRPSTEAIMDAANLTLGRAYLAKAVATIERAKKKAPAEEFKDLEIARTYLDKARTLNPSDNEIDAIFAKITATQQRLEVVMNKKTPVRERSDYISRQKNVTDLLKEGREYYHAKDLNNAELTYAAVLKRDEYNSEAMRYLRKISEERYEAHSLEREATAAAMIDDVRKSWTPAKREALQMPTGGNGQTNIIRSSVLQKKMEGMIIPEINFRQANIADVVTFLVEASVQADADKVGVNIILNLNLPTSAGNGPADAVSLNTRDSLTPADLLAAPTAGNDGNGAGANPQASTIPTITLNLRRVSLLNAVKYICEVAGLRFRLEDNAVIITPANVVVGTVMTRLYPVQSAVFETNIRSAAENAASNNRGGGGGGGGGGAFIGMDGGTTSMEREDVKGFFEKAGVPFPQGTSITYNPQISKLIVANTADNLEKLEQILAALQITPSQVEIEARFVELNQTDLQEFGIEWMLTDNYEIATQKGGTPLGGTPSIVAKGDALGITKGLHFFGFDTSSGLISPSTAATSATGVGSIGNILTFAGVLTNPELQAVLHALDQHGAADILSAPRVTTRSGVNAQIQVVREIIYPTEFETTQPQFGTSSFAGTTVVTPPLVTPGSFETREVGVILNATPTVQPDGYSIDLVLAPEVSELEGWINYGSTFGDFIFNIPQPIFNTRKVTTTIVIWDGQTVVMGGLIREALTKTKDKIPLLGDLPLIGRLFRSEGEFSQKKNLMIFVTARLVDPAGKPIHAPGALSMEAAPTSGVGQNVAP